MNQPTQTQPAQSAPKMMAVPEHLLVAAVNTVATRVQGTYAELQPLIVGLQSCQAVEEEVRRRRPRSRPARSQVTSPASVAPAQE